jgi:DNA-binding XRE family transcriptional regulator
MLLTPEMLPPFDQADLDLRFLAEADRLLREGAASSYTDLAKRMGVRTGLFSEIEAGRYHCNLKLLYALAQHFPEADVNFIFFGPVSSDQHQPTQAPARPLGRRPAA